MRILIILLLTISSMFGEILKLEWDANPTDQVVTQYKILISDSTPIDLGGGVYNYDTYVSTSSTNTSFVVSDTQVTYMTIMAYNAKGWSPVSTEVKNTPYRVMSIQESIANNPANGVLSLKYTITDDAGSYILVEASDDLIVWEVYGRYIIEFGDIHTEYIPIDRPRRFFRSSYITGTQGQSTISAYEYQAPIEVEVTTEPPEVFTAPKKPKQTIPKRKNKHETIHRPTWTIRGKH